MIIGIFITVLFGLLHGYGWPAIQEGIVANIAISVPVPGHLFCGGHDHQHVDFVRNRALSDQAWPDHSGANRLSSGDLRGLRRRLGVHRYILGHRWHTGSRASRHRRRYGCVPMHLTAGAVVSGAWFGDKMSPLSDTTNFAAAIVGANLYAHIRNMFPSTIPAMAIALVLYSVIGAKFSSESIQTESLSLLVETIDKTFTLNFLVLIPPAVIALTIIRKIPALPGIFLGVVAAGFVAIVVQGASPGTVMKTMMNGYASNSGNEQLDTLLSKGGVMSMMWVVSLIMIAMAFGGVLEKTQCLSVIIRAILKRISRRSSLIVAALVSSFGFNLCSNAFIAYTVPGRMFAPAFRGKNLSTTNLSRVLEDGATMSAPLIPWKFRGSLRERNIRASNSTIRPIRIF